MEDLQAAIVGYGLAGRFFHAPLIAGTDGLSVSAVVTSDTQRQEAVVREHPGALAVPAVEELWERIRPDLLVIAAPNEVHATLAREAIRRRVPVVVDKPLAVTAADARALVAEAEQAGVMLTVFQNRRWDSDHLTLRRLLAVGALGSVFRYESRLERWRPVLRADAWRETLAPDRGGGQLLDLGSHLVDQALVLFGPVSHVYGEVDARRGADGDDDAFLSLRHESGVISHLRASAVTAAPGPRLRVLGTQAAFMISGLDSQEAELRSGRRPGPEWGAEPQSSWGRVAAGEDTEIVPSERGDWPCFYRLLVTALRDGGPPPVDPRDAVAVLDVIERARQSAARQTVVAVRG